MPRVQFSDVGLRAIKPPPRGTADYWDASLPSFGMRVSHGGAKTFVLKIQNSRRAIGRFPLISLSKARDEAKRLLAEKTLGKVRPQSITFPRAVELFLAEKEKGRRPSTVADLSDRLSRHFPFKGQLADITHQDIVRRLSSIKTNREHNHALRVGKTFFTWALNRRYITENPTIGISTRATSSRARVLSDDEVKCIWRACEQAGEIGLHTPTRRWKQVQSETSVGKKAADPNADFPRLPTNFCTIVKLLILTGMRRGECAALQSSWIQKQSSSSSKAASELASLPYSSATSPSESLSSSDLWTLTIPASVTKNGREHTFPLGSNALQILKPYISGSGFFFPARGKDSPFNGWSKSKAALDKLSGVTDWTLHDLRRTYATNLAALGIAPHIVERLLNHASGTISGVAAIYNRHHYEAECRAAVEAYERHLQKLISST